MFINSKNDNSIKDEELNENLEDTKFSMFSRHKGEDEIVDDNSKKHDKKEKKVKNNDNDLVDYNQKFLKDNQKNTGNEFVKIIKTIVCFAVAVGVVVLLVPSILHYDNSHKKDYVDYVNEMVDKVITYYNKKDMNCTTTTKDVYYFDINKSDEMFGEKYISPFIKNPLEGYVEFDGTRDNYTVYVSFTDGMFGFDRIEYSKLNASDVKLFTYLSLARHEEMRCDMPFVFSN